MRGERRAVVVNAHETSSLTSWSPAGGRFIWKHTNLFADPVLEARAQRKNLKSAAVGDDRAVPTHEAVQSTELLDDLCSGPQEQVVRVGQQHRRTDVAQ